MRLTVHRLDAKQDEDTTVLDVTIDDAAEVAAKGDVVVIRGKYTYQVVGRRFEYDTQGGNLVQLMVRDAEPFSY